MPQHANLSSSFGYNVDNYCFYQIFQALRWIKFMRQIENTPL